MSQSLGSDVEILDAFAPYQLAHLPAPGFLNKYLSSLFHALSPESWHSSDGYNETHTFTARAVSPQGFIQVTLGREVEQEAR